MGILKDRKRKVLETDISIDHRGPVGVFGRGARLPGLLRGPSLSMRAP
jgi:hypothetical protein